MSMNAAVWESRERSASVMLVVATARTLLAVWRLWLRLRTRLLLRLRLRTRFWAWLRLLRMELWTRLLLRLRLRAWFWTRLDLLWMGLRARLLSLRLRTRLGVRLHLLRMELRTRLLLRLHLLRIECGTRLLLRLRLTLRLSPRLCLLLTKLLPRRLLTPRLRAHFATSLRLNPLTRLLLNLLRPSERLRAFVALRRLRILPQPLTLTLPDPRLLSQGRILHRTRHTALPPRGIHVTASLLGAPHPWHLRSLTSALQTLLRLLSHRHMRLSPGRLLTTIGSSLPPRVL